MSNARILDEQIDQLSHVFQVQLDGAPIVDAVDRRLEEIGKTAQIRGFRKGRAPLSVLRNHYGRQVRDAIVDHVAIEVTRDLVHEKGLEPIRRPTIHVDDSGSHDQAIEFTLTLEVAPRFELQPFDFSLRRLRTDDATLEPEAEAHLRRQLFDTLMQQYDFPVPREMVQNEFERIKHGFDSEVGESVDEELSAELQAIAERRIRLAILFTEIGRAHNIRVTREEVDALIEHHADQSPEHRSEIIDYYLDHPTAVAELQSPLFEDRVVAFLLDQSRIDEVAVSVEEFRNALETP